MVRILELTDVSGCDSLVSDAEPMGDVTVSFSIPPPPVLSSVSVFWELEHSVVRY